MRLRSTLLHRRISFSSLWDKLPKRETLLPVPANSVPIAHAQKSERRYIG